MPFYFDVKSFSYLSFLTETSSVIATRYFTQCGVNYFKAHNEVTGIEFLRILQYICLDKIQLEFLSKVVKLLSRKYC